MVWTDAQSVVAMVANQHPIRDRTVMEFPRMPMCVNLTTTYFDAPITTSVPVMAGPIPATV